ncbi:hypothetical protein YASMINEVIRUS_1542, partial [Yasminevirus sp. GU-2018]
LIRLQYDTVLKQLFFKTIKVNKIMSVREVIKKQRKTQKALDYSEYFPRIEQFLKRQFGIVVNTSRQTGQKNFTVPQGLEMLFTYLSDNFAAKNEDKTSNTIDLNEMVATMLNKKKISSIIRNEDYLSYVQYRSQNIK